MATRIFLCNRQDRSFDVESWIMEATQRFLTGVKFEVVWTCGNIKSIEVGDRAYFKSVEEKNHGFFARGRVIKAEDTYRLNRHPGCEGFSAAYWDNGDSSGLAVAVEWDSWVSYSNPLTISFLKAQPELQGANFFFRQSGQSFRDEYTDALDYFWKQYLQRG